MGDGLSSSVGASPRSALSESLLHQHQQGCSTSAPRSVPHASVDLHTAFSDGRPPRPPIVRTRSMRTDDEAPGEQPSHDLGFGTSPLIGSPWPYLIRQQQQQQLSPATPREESPRPRTAWEHRPSSDFGARHSTPGLRIDEEEPLLASSGAGEDPELGGDSSGKAAASRSSAGLFSDMLYGLINAIVGAPTMISFAAIIFSDPFFSKYLGQLSRLAFLASAIHQAVFTALSTLPFAVGQVQDVGLIFLSAMASAIVQDGLKHDIPKEEILGTTLMTITISTFIVGLLIILVGQFKLASLVQYVPLSTVGGYLGYVGYFCLAAGVGLACNTTISGFETWVHLLHKDQLIKLAPALAATLTLYLTMHYSRSPLALPAVLLCIPLIFHAVLLGTGTTLAEAADRGWVMEAQEGKNFWELYRMFNIHDWKLSGLDKTAIVKQAPKVLALFFVVAFGSSLDVAAIQAGLADPLDFNHELKTVGASNMVSGLLGAGFTGSYIFSQTIFSMRARVTSKIHGIIIAGAELALFAIPISVIQYMPNFFFGALLMLFGIEIIADWLIFSHRKVLHTEFVMLWATYLAIMFTNLEAGIGIGIVLATLYFAFSYARVNVKAFTVVPSRSGVVRSLSERTVLEVFMAKSAALSLSGYIFFGSSVSIAERVTTVAKALVQHDEELQRTLVSQPQEKAGPDPDSHPLWSADSRQRTREALAAAPRFILLDFRLVHGLDATAAQSFGTLWVQLRRQGVELLLTHLRSKPMQRLLEAHGVTVDSQASKGAAPTEAARVFESMDHGVQHCEDRLLEIARQYGLCQPHAPVMSLEDTLRSHDEIPSMMLGRPVDYKRVADSLRVFMEVLIYREGEALFEPGDETTDLFVVEEGLVCMESSFNSLYKTEHELPLSEDLMPKLPNRTFHFPPGSIIGTTDFFLRRPRSFKAVAAKDTRTLSISKPAFDRVSAEAPEALIVLLTIVARTSVMNSLHVWEYLERMNASS